MWGPQKSMIEIASHFFVDLRSRLLLGSPLHWGASTQMDCTLTYPMIIIVAHPIISIFWISSLEYLCFEYHNPLQLSLLRRMEEIYLSCQLNDWDLRRWNKGLHAQLRHNLILHNQKMTCVTHRDMLASMQASFSPWPPRCHNTSPWNHSPSLK
jgi:hypothetical protein